jgi:hypothetical protein
MVTPPDQYPDAWQHQLVVGMTHLDAAPHFLGYTERFGAASIYKKTV